MKQRSFPQAAGTLARRLWCRILLGCAAVIGFGSACCQQSAPVYGILMTAIDDDTPVRTAERGALPAEGADGQDNSQGRSR